MRKRLLYADPPCMAALVERSAKLMESPAFQVVKAEGRTRAGLLVRPERPAVFIKRTAARSWIAGLYDRFAGSRAARALAGARIVRDAGFHCAAPLAAMDVLAMGAVRENY